MKVPGAGAKPIFEAARVIRFGRSGARHGFGSSICLGKGGEKGRRLRLELKSA